MYNVSDIDNWDCICSFPARGVRWNITDLDLSLDHRQMIYCSVGPVVSLIRLATDNQGSDYQSLILNSDDMEYGIFSCKFSAQGDEILVGTRMRSIEIHDLERKTLNYNIAGAHDDEINSACFGSQESQVIYSGSDDCLIKIWDRRVNSENPQGVLIGHREGITNVSSKGDGIKLVSNSKDQSIKLWDIRKLNSQNFCRQYLRTHRFSTGLDYRFGGYILEGYTKKLSADTSLLTFRGHKILGTLIRCYFSPLHTTNQRFIYTGSADGKVYIYDTYSGMSVWTLSEQGDSNETEDSICRDVSWHPYLSFIASTSFSGSINHYSYQ
jgi:WD repeat-containing protein 23